MSSKIERLDLTIGGLATTVWKPKGISGDIPVIVFSHGLKGCRLQSIYLTEALAGAGFLVVAPDHADAFGTCPPPSIEAVALAAVPHLAKQGIKLAAELGTRLKEMKSLVDELQNPGKKLFEIDWSRFGLAGHSLGGATVLALGGAWPSAKMPGVKAILAMSPYGEPLEKKGNLALVAGPVMFQTGTEDDVQGAWTGYDKAKSPAYYVEFKDADHFAWTDLRNTARDSINVTSIDFFRSAFAGTKASVIKGGDVHDAESK